MAKKYKWCACGAYLVMSPHQCDSRHLPPIEAPAKPTGWNSGFAAGKLAGAAAERERVLTIIAEVGRDWNWIDRDQIERRIKERE